MDENEGKKKMIIKVTLGLVVGGLLITGLVFLIKFIKNKNKNGNGSGNGNGNGDGSEGTNLPVPNPKSCSCDCSKCENIGIPSNLIRLIAAESHLYYTLGDKFANQYLRDEPFPTLTGNVNLNEAGLYKLTGSLTFRPDANLASPPNNLYLVIVLNLKNDTNTSTIFSYHDQLFISEKNTNINYNLREIIFRFTEVLRTGGINQKLVLSISSQRGAGDGNNQEKTGYYDASKPSQHWLQYGYGVPASGYSFTLLQLSSS